MTFQRLVIRNVLRNKRRTGLTVLSVGFSLFLLIALTTFMQELLGPPTTEASALRLIVRRSTSLADELPIAHMDKIRRIPGVRTVIPLQWFNGVYKDPKYLFANFATDPVGIWQVRPELVADPETKRRFAAERNAAVAGRKLMERFGWKPGDRITLQGTIFPIDLELVIVGPFDDETDRNSMYFRHDYLDEGLGGRGKVGAFYVQAASAGEVPGVIDAVDALFRNSPAETKTETEKAFVLGFISMLGNVRVMVGSIALVVVFTMLLVSASTMAMTIRERLREIAILKAIGYPRRIVLAIILGESVFLSLLGFALGAGIAVLLGSVDLYSVTQGFIQRFQPAWSIYAMTLLTGAGIGLASGIVPAVQASNMTITEAMRRLE